MSGRAGSTSPPTPEMTQRAVKVSSSPVVRIQLPALLVEAGVDDLGVEAQVGTQLPLLDQAQQVVLDLVGRRELEAPVRLRLEGERVDVGGHVARGAGVGVVAPGAADLPGALEHREGADARLLEADGHADAGEARTDDGNGEVGAARVAPRSLSHSVVETVPVSRICRDRPRPTLRRWWSARAGSVS